MLLVFAYLCLLGIDVYVLDHESKNQITEILKTWVPWGLRINFFLILAAVLICLKDLLDLAKGFMNRKGVFLAALFCFAFSLSFFVAPKTHRIFYDEDIYANVGQNIALAGKTGFCNYGTFEYGEYFPHWLSYNKEPSGWPFLISLPFQLFGVNESYAFLLNNLLFSVGALLAFFILWHLTGRFFASAMAGLAYALIPHNLLWSNTAAAEPSAAVLAGFAVLSLVVYLKTRRNRHLFLMVLMFPFACQMRPESVLIFPWALAALLIISPKTLAGRKLWSFGLLTTLFLLPHFLHFYAVSGHSWGAEGNKFSLAFVGHNLETNGLYYLKNKSFPVVITVLALLGVICYRGLFTWRLLLLFWFLPFWALFLFFYAGSYGYGADVRFALVSFMPLAILAGMGGGWVRDRLDTGIQKLKEERTQQRRYGRTLSSALVALLMLFAAMRFMPLVQRVGQEAWGSRFDHKYAKEFIRKIPERSIVLTQNPTMFLLWHQNAIQTYAGINDTNLIKNLLDRYQGHVYFHYNYWCNTQSQRNVNLCQSIRDKYDLEEVVKTKEQNYEYGLYRLRLKE